MVPRSMIRHRARHAVLLSGDTSPQIAPASIRVRIAAATGEGRVKHATRVKAGGTMLRDLQGTTLPGVKETF